jgi:hypothetical protein
MTHGAPAGLEGAAGPAGEINLVQRALQDIGAGAGANGVRLGR